MGARRLRISGFDEACGWQVNAAGAIFRHRRRQPITDEIAGLPTIDLGPEYGGNVPKPGRDHCTLRLLDEVVCYEFRGAPPGGWAASHPHHIDGDAENCAAANLVWVADNEFLEWRSFNYHKGLLRPSNLQIRQALKGVRMDRGQARPSFTESATVVGHIPTIPLAIGA